MEFHDFSMTTVIFHDFQGLENFFLKLCDIPVETLKKLYTGDPLYTTMTWQQSHHT